MYGEKQLMGTEDQKSTVLEMIIRDLRKEMDACNYSLGELTGLRYKLSGESAGPVPGSGPSSSAESLPKSLVSQLEFHLGEMIEFRNKLANLTQSLQNTI